MLAVDAIRDTASPLPDLAEYACPVLGCTSSVPWERLAIGERCAVDGQAGVRFTSTATPTGAMRTAVPESVMFFRRALARLRAAESLGADAVRIR